MSYTNFYKPELIRRSQKDSEMIQQISQNICNIFEYFFQLVKYTINSTRLKC
ncbi:unnamed protein product (macronuclear) [Paramecium tetraurelia]|uniref:Uncharacterized protein n=1 Tax=Paramecium tetraurelia TaxID=5888 RepID=A0E5V8_PARTE|nr:uncharacterized protein GSPATT00003538001 [Paramecium tetraurelia]CAK90675.1 unnamed protein product [Paramecium tetraurelia]|eukprot:XP_001458072.1 hypothetical protein (macronuclear) [Paramecium tetraurelia strain d4-2]